MKKQIVFVEATPNIMGGKIAKALKNKGHETVLVSCLKFDKKQYKSSYSKIICLDLDAFSINLKNGISILKKTSKILKAFFELKKLNPYVVIGVNIPYPLWLPALTRYTVKKAPFIFFPYDVNILRFNKKKYYKRAGIRKSELRFEKYLFENSDGILLKGKESKFVKNKFQINSPIIEFPPYCSKEFMVPINNHKLSKKDKEFHIVYIGNACTEKDFKDALGFLSWEKEIKEIIEQKIHFHIYSGNYISIKNSKDYENILKNKYFHLHKPLDPFEIIKEISKYDFGIWLYNFDFKIFNKKFISLGMGNKFASFLEAGLPCIYSKDLISPLNLMKKYDLDLQIDFTKMKYLKKLLNNYNYNRLIENIKKARKDLTFENNIYKLEEFFKIIQKN